MEFWNHLRTYCEQAGAHICTPVYNGSEAQEFQLSSQINKSTEGPKIEMQSPLKGRDFADVNSIRHKEKQLQVQRSLNKIQLPPSHDPKVVLGELKESCVLANNEIFRGLTQQTFKEKDTLMASPEIKGFWFTILIRWQEELQLSSIWAF